MDSLEQILDLLKELSPEDRAEVEQLALSSTEDKIWVPNPGPQTEAYFSLADEVFYGGQAGGGKTDLLLGLGLTNHKRSLVLRRTNKEVNGLVERMTGIVGNRDGYNSQTGMWRRPDRVIEFGGCQLEDDKQKYKGNPRDFIGWDELSDFTESQYVFVNTWNRSAIPGQRCRIVAASNPPTRPEGLWVLRRWAAWLDPSHPNPAKPGELRWYTTNENGEEVEVNGPGPHYIGGRELYARSRTFIPATLQDNPDLKNSGYQASLDSLPEELRAAYRDGNFTTTMKDDAYQVIPTQWVKEAQQRWTAQPPVGVPMCAIGCDVAIAHDNFVLAPRHDAWFDKLLVVPGREIKDPKHMAGKIIAIRRNNATVVIDAGGGYGADASNQLVINGVDVFNYMGVKPSKRKTKDGKFTFANVRSEAYWKMREALDPSQPGGSRIALPVDSILTADLCAPSYQVKGRDGGMVLSIESKEDIIKRLARSPDRGDAVVMSWYNGRKQENIQGGWTGAQDGSLRNVSVNRGKRYDR